MTHENCKKYTNEKKKEWILITLKACFLKTATPKFQKCKGNNFKILAKLWKVSGKEHLWMAAS